MKITIEIKSILSWVGVTVLLFLTFYFNYYTYFKPHPLDQKFQLYEIRKEVSKLLSDDDINGLNSLIDRFDFGVIITGSDLSVITSNLGNRYQTQRVTLAQGKLDEDDGIGNPIQIGKKQAFIFYLPDHWFKEAFLPVFIWCLLLGAIFGLFVYRIEFVLLKNQISIIELQEYADKSLNIDELESEVKSLRKFKKKNQAQLSMYKKQLENHAIELVKTRNTNQLRKLKTKKLEEQLLSMNNFSDDLVEKIKNLEVLEAKLQDYKHENQEKDSDISNLKNLVKHKDKEIFDLTKEIAHFKQIISQKTEMNQNLLESNMKLKESLRNFQEVKNKLFNIQYKLKLMTQNYSKLQSKNKILIQNKKQLLSVLNQKEELVNKVVLRFNELKNSNRELSTEVKKQLELIIRFPKSLVEAEKEIRKLISEKDLIEKENVQLVVEIADKASQNNSLNQRVSSTLQELEETKNQLKSRQEELNDFEQEIDRLSDVLVDKISEIQELNHSKLDLDLSIEKLMLERDELKSFIIDLEELIQSQEIEIEESKEINLALESELQEFKLNDYPRKLEQKELSIGILKHDAKNFRKKLKNLRKDKKVLKSQIELLQKEKSENYDVISKLYKELDALKSRNQLLKEHISNSDEFWEDTSPDLI